MLIVMIELSVCIATWCRKDDLIQIVDRLEHQTLERDLYEIIIVDSGSVDGTEEAIKNESKKYENIVYIKDAPNILASKRNVGIKHSKGNVVVFMDDDVYPEKGFLEAHYRANKDNDNTFFCGQIRFDEKLVANSNYYRFRDEQHLVSEDAGKDLPFNKIVVMNLSFKKQFIEKVGFVNEHFIGYGCEDMEFGFRIKQLGFRLEYLPDALAIHREKSSSIKEYGSKLYKTGLYGMRILKQECPLAYKEIDGKHKIFKKILSLKFINGSLEKRLSKNDGIKKKYSYLSYKLYLYSMMELGKRDQKRIALLSIEDAKKGW